MAEELSDKTHSELLALQSLAASDIEFFKQQQWKVTNYALLLYGTIIAAPKIIGTPLHTIEYAALWFVGLLIVLVGIYVLNDLETSLKKGRDRLPEARRHFNREISLTAYACGGDPDDSLKNSQDKPSLKYLFVSVLVVGFVFVTWILARMWCNA